MYKTLHLLKVVFGLSQECLNPSCICLTFHGDTNVFHQPQCLLLVNLCFVKEVELKQVEITLRSPFVFPCYSKLQEAAAMPTNTINFRYFMLDQHVTFVLQTKYFQTIS